MKKYISLDAIVAEIERRLEAIANASSENNRELAAIQGAQQYELINLIQYIHTLEVKEVDLDAEFDKYCETLYLIDLENEPYAELFECAKHFFELGLKTQHKISYVPNIDDSLKELGVDPSSKEAKIFKESYYIALEKLKAQKGE